MCAGLKCPQCGSEVTQVTTAYSEPIPMLTTDGKTTNGYLRDVPLHEERHALLGVFVGCNSCDWCGARRDAAI